MTLDRLQVTIAGIRLNVPVCGDRETTLKAAQEVTRRFREIEERSGRIDTQAFALEAALSLAAELELRDDQDREETAALLKELDGLAEILRGLLSDFPALKSPEENGSGQEDA